MDPIPVDYCRQVADEYTKDIVVIVGWDGASNRTHITTWGRSSDQKTGAAIAGEKIEKALGLGTDAIVYEDYRREGESMMLVDKFRRQLVAIREAIDKIVIDDGQDAGVILLSDESPTHWDEETKCHIYEHENFSPLGDALVALAKLARAEAME